MCCSSGEMRRVGCRVCWVCSVLSCWVRCVSSFSHFLSFALRLCLSVPPPLSFPFSLSLPSISLSLFSSLSLSLIHPSLLPHIFSPYHSLHFLFIPQPHHLSVNICLFQDSFLYVPLPSFVLFFTRSLTSHPLGARKAAISAINVQLHILSPRNEVEMLITANNFLAPCVKVI